MLELLELEQRALEYAQAARCCADPTRAAKLNALALRYAQQAMDLLETASTERRARVLA